MAAPTDVAVESNSISTAIIRWTYAGTSTIAVYRSTDGISYSEVTSAGSRVEVGTTEYSDTGLTAGTKYWYKLSDDAGSTFSSVVTVVVQECVPAAGRSDTFTLPRSYDANVGSDEFNNLAERVEALLHGRVLVPGDCIACVNDGALVIPCTESCKNWLVIVDEDINSVSLHYCDEGEGTIELIVPPGTTRKICGFPAGFGFLGDECREAPISGGSTGRTVGIPTSPGGRGSPAARSRPGTSRGAGPGGGSGGAGCTCTTNGEGDLAIKSCNSNNSLKCSSTKSLQLKACGGVAPYTWTKTGTIQLSTTEGPATTVTPPTNTGSAVAGTAYWHSFYECNGCAGSACNAVAGEVTVLRGCDDSSSGCTTTSFCTLPAASAMTCGCGAGSPGQPGCGNTPQVCGSCGTGVCATRQAGNGEGRYSTVCDQRTAGMISDGCNPCGLAASGATVTVTDAVGTQVTIVLRS